MANMFDMLKTICNFCFFSFTSFSFFKKKNGMGLGFFFNVILLIFKILFIDVCFLKINLVSPVSL